MQTSLSLSLSLFYTQTSNQIKQWWWQACIVVSFFIVKADSKHQLQFVMYAVY